jgi:hypothetical protein
MKSGNILEVHEGVIGVRRLLQGQDPPTSEILALKIDDILLEKASFL